MYPKSPSGRGPACYTTYDYTAYDFGIFERLCLLSVCPAGEERALAWVPPTA